MEASTLLDHLQHVLDSRWQPQWRLTSAERDNLVRWDGARRDFLENYLLSVQFPDSRAALWLRHVIRVPPSQFEAIEVQVTAVLFDHARGQHQVFDQRFAPAQVAWDKNRFVLRVGSCELTHATARGELAGGAIRWDLNWEPSRVSTRPLVFNTLYQHPAVATKVVLPNVAVRMWGRVATPERELHTTLAPGQQAHVWGRRYPRRWMWARVGGFDEASNCHLEAAQVQDTLGAQPSPWWSTLRLCYRNRIYQFNRVVADLTRAGVEHRREGWRFSVGRGRLQFLGEILAQPQSAVGLHLHDPDGGSRALQICASATTRLQVLRRRGLVFRPEAVLTARRCWYEVADSVANLGLPLAL